MFAADRIDIAVWSGVLLWDALPIGVDEKMLASRNRQEGSGSGVVGEAAVVVEAIGGSCVPEAQAFLQEHAFLAATSFALPLGERARFHDVVARSAPEALHMPAGRVKGIAALPFSHGTAAFPLPAGEC